MSLFDIFNMERRKRSFEELKKKLQLNPDYIREAKALKLERELKRDSFALNEYMSSWEFGI